VILWWLACSAPDPALVRDRAALDAWTAGASALAAGDPSGARTAFDQALTARPDDALLLAWKAKALADSGDLAGAAALAGQSLALRPDAAVVRYNQAAWLARSGQLDAAAPALARAIADGAATGADAAADADFLPHLSHPAFAFLPRAALDVTASVSDGAQFLGTETPLRLRVRAAGPVAVQGALNGPIAVAGVVEEVQHDADGGVRQITWSLRVLGPGEARIGPLTVTADGRTAEVPIQGFPCVAPPDSPPAAPSGALWTPAALAGDWPLPSAWRRDDLLWVKRAATDAVSVGGAPPSVRLELREGGQTRFVVAGWRAAPADAVVRLTRLGGATEVLTTQPLGGP
jgi:hypothetical protein